MPSTHYDTHHLWAGALIRKYLLNKGALFFMAQSVLTRYFAAPSSVTDISRTVFSVLDVWFDRYRCNLKHKRGWPEKESTSPQEHIQKSISNQIKTFCTRQHIADEKSYPGTSLTQQNKKPPFRYPFTQKLLVSRPHHNRHRTNRLQVKSVNNDNANGIEVKEYPDFPGVVPLIAMDLKLIPSSRWVFMNRVASGSKPCFF
ncbi:hypothetical protein VTN00DRAFT_1181 [Thermoascus crustaceus]|uniref:uncharacterized protein n=1 Tax=Thermoascus crustaceus TaxID=5088 RepID=UPI0037420A12